VPAAHISRYRTLSSYEASGVTGMCFYSETNARIILQESGAQVVATTGCAAMELI
jgi:hypothetical protein